MSFACRPDMLDGTRCLGNYTLNPQSPVRRVVNAGSSIGHHSILGSVLAHPAMKHGMIRGFMKLLLVGFEREDLKRAGNLIRPILYNMSLQRS
jgi:hypothetical protein